MVPKYTIYPSGSYANNGSNELGCLSIIVSDDGTV